MDAADVLAVDDVGRVIVLALPFLATVALLLWFLLVVRKQPPQQRRRSSFVLMALLLLTVVATGLAPSILG